jgi:hypothetical protein
VGKIYFGKLWILSVSLMATELTVAQNVGINTSGATPNAAAILDLNTGNAGTMGFLPEQVALTATNVAAPIVLPPTGIIVYNTATAGVAPNNVIPGYYYWDGAKWQLMLTGSGSTTLAWTVMGNTGITASTSPINTAANNNFIGTTNAADFVMAANGFERMRIANGTGNIGIANIAPTTMLQIGNAATTVGKLSVFSQDNAFGQVQIGNPVANAEASMQFISGVTAFGNPPTSSGGNANLWNIGVGSYGVTGTKFNIADFAFGPVMTWTSAGLVGVNTVNPQQNLSVNHGVNIDQANGNNGLINNGLVTGDALSFGSNSGEGIADNRNSSAGYEEFGLQFYTGYVLAMNISNPTSGTQPSQVSITNGLNVDQAGVNNGFLDNNLATGNGITFGLNSGEGIASKRTAGGNLFGLDFYTGFTERMCIRQTGQVGIGTLTPGQALELAWPTSTMRIDGIAAGNSYYSTVTPPTAASSIVFANNTNGDVQALAPSATNGQVLTQTATGPAWQSMSSVNNMQVITTTGTYTPSAGTKSILVRMVGGGGGGGGVAGTNHVANDDALAAGGGGAGGYCEYFISSVAASYPVTVGAAGAGAAPGNNAGGSGGSSIFNGVTAGGGSGGSGSGALTGPFFNAGGAGGTAVGGTANIPGNSGANGVILVNSAFSATIPGAGGSTPLGSGGIAPNVINNVTAGLSGTGYGSGGSGADSNWQSAGDNGAGSGGSGAPGVIIIYEYK